VWGGGKKGKETSRRHSLIISLSEKGKERKEEEVPVDYMQISGAAWKRGGGEVLESIIMCTIINLSRREEGRRARLNSFFLSTVKA